MTVGEALAEARYRAGLTVDEVSERTRIREAVIRCIEQDDYAACGGDLYVRGYVRAIAGAVGIDAQPLIRDFDSGRGKGGNGSGSASAAYETDPAVPAADPAPTVAEPGFAFSDMFSDPDEGYTFAEPVYRVADPEPILEDPAPTVADPGFTAADVAAFSSNPPHSPASPPAPPSPPARPSALRGRIRGRPWVIGILVLVALAAVAVGVAGSHIISSLRQAPAANSTPAVQQQKAPASPSQGAPSAGASTAPSTAPSQPKAASPSASPHPASAGRRLPIAIAEAFGPDGTADGDNPQGAMSAIAPGSASPWQTDWYTTANFGMLKDGTGLLLDLGKPVTITSVRIGLASYAGADLQLRAGDTAVLRNMGVAARASNAGGTVLLRLAAPVRARYLVIWFTKLAPDGAGTYQESVYSVIVNGRP